MEGNYDYHQQVYQADAGYYRGPADATHGNTDKVIQGSKVLSIGGVTDMIANLIVVILFVMLLIGAARSEDNTSTNDDSDSPFSSFGEILFYGILFLDIVAFLILGIGALIFQGNVPLSDSLRKTVRIAGGLAIGWAVLSLLWRFILPLVAVGQFIELFAANVDVDDLLMTLRLIFILAIVASLVFPAVFIFLKKLLVQAGKEYGAPVETKLLSFAIGGAIFNSLINLMWQVPILQAFTGGETIGYDIEGTFTIVMIMKILVLPYVLMIGSYGIYKNSKIIVNHLSVKA